MRARIGGVFVLAVIALPAQDRITLREAEALALQNNPQVETARLSAEAAGYAPVLARSPLQPQLSAGFHALGTQEGTRLTGGGFTNPALLSRVGFGVGLNQMVTDFGRTRLLAESALSRAKAESAYAIGVRAVTILSVRQAFFAALRAQAVLRVAEETIKARTLAVEQVRALSDAKLRSGLDLSFVEVSLSEALLVRSAVQNERQAALADLSSALGLKTPKEFELVYEAPALDNLDTSTELLPEAASNRPDLSARKLEAVAAAQFAEAEQKLDRPTVSATGAAGYSPAHSKQLTRDEYVAAGVSITLPLLNGGAFKARQAEAAVRARVAESRLRELENRIARDINVTQLNLRTARQRIELTKQLTEQAGKSADLAQARYDLGLSSIIELSQAQLARLQAEIQNATAQYEFHLQHSLLEFHLGRLR